MGILPSDVIRYLFFLGIVIQSIFTIVIAIIELANCNTVTLFFFVNQI